MEAFGKFSDVKGAGDFADLCMDIRAKVIRIADVITIPVFVFFPISFSSEKN